MITDGDDGVRVLTQGNGEIDLFLVNNTITNNSGDGIRARSKNNGDTYIYIFRMASSGETEIMTFI